VQADLIAAVFKAQEGMQALRALATAPNRFPATKTHKASSAEAILKYCLRQLGFTRRWKEGRLTGRQHLQLLEAIRQYGRAWMRHEAETFFEHYGVRDELSRADQGRDGSSSEVRNIDRREADSLDSCRMSSDQTGEWSMDRGTVERGLSARILSPLRRWFDRAKQFVRESIHAGVTAMTGRPLEADEAAEADRLAGVQDAFLDSFETEFKARPSPEITEPSIFPAPKPISAAQFAARAELYGNAAWQAAQKVQRGRIIKTPVNVMLDEKGKVVDLVAEPPGVTLPYPIAGPPPGKGKRPKPGGPIKWERRKLGNPPTGHCSDCPPLADMGWQPIGTLPDIGDTECGGFCWCWFEYSDSVEPPAAGKLNAPGSAGNAIPQPKASSEGIDLVAEPPGMQVQAPIAGPPPK
jgi:hypothetical protein